MVGPMVLPLDFHVKIKSCLSVVRMAPVAPMIAYTRSLNECEPLTVSGTVTKMQLTEVPIKKCPPALRVIGPNSC